MSRQLRSIAEAMAVVKMSPQLAAKVAARVAPALSALERKAFASRQSPYGDPWGRGTTTGKPITEHKSGALEAKATDFQAVGTKVRSSVSSVRWARYQIKHGILPRGGAALPAEWEATIKRIADEETARAVEGAR